MKAELNSAVALAKLLRTEGFTDYVANGVEKYWKKHAGLTDRQRRQIAKLEKSLSEIASKLDIKERLVLGKFIGLHKKMSFDAGLRIGLTVFERKVNGDSK